MMRAPISPRPPSWDAHFRAARRRNRMIETRAGRAQIIILIVFAVWGVAHLLDRAAAGVTACAYEQLAQCPEGTR